MNKNFSYWNETHVLFVTFFFQVYGKRAFCQKRIKWEKFQGCTLKVFIEDLPLWITKVVYHKQGRGKSNTIGSDGFTSRLRRLEVWLQKFFFRLTIDFLQFTVFLDFIDIILHDFFSMLWRFCSIFCNFFPWFFTISSCLFFFSNFFNTFFFFFLDLSKSFARFFYD